MAVRSGFVDYLDWGAGASTSASVGKVTGGSWDIDGKIEWVTTMGGVAHLKAGMVAATCSATFTPAGTDAETLLNYAIRATPTSPTLTDLCLQGGTSSEAFQFLNTKVNRLSLKCSVESQLEATMDFVARTPSAIAVPSWRAANTLNPFNWWGGTCTIGGAAYTMQDFTVNIDNRIRAYSSLDTKSADTRRFPEELVVGVDEVTGSFSTAVPLGSGPMVEPWVDDPDQTVAFSLALTNLGTGGQTLTITGANFVMTGWSMPFVTPDDIVITKFEYSGKPNTSGTIAITCA